MTTRTLELDLNETGFLCNMITNAIRTSNLPVDAEGGVQVPIWLADLFAKLAKANNEMMAENQVPQIILPSHFNKGH